MVIVSYSPKFEEAVGKIRDSLVKEKVKKQIMKLLENPEVGKPMRFGRSGTRELYVSPYRLSYVYDKERDEIIILDFYHKDMQ